MPAEEVQLKYSKRSAKWKLIIVLLIVALAAAIIACLNVGYAPISFLQILRILGKQIPFLSGSISSSSISSVSESIIIQIRLPRVLAAAIVGAGLAAAGVIYQGVFRNPMADSYLTGSSAGASFAYTLAVLFAGTGALTVFGLGLYQAAAFIGAMATVFIVYFMSRVGNKVPVTTLLLSGVVVNVFILALQTIFELRSGQALLGIVAWIAGGFTNITWIDVYAIFPFILAGIVMAYFFTRDLNMLAMGDDTAQYLGVNTERVRQILLVIGSLITAACVSVSGVIGFVGLIIPHMTRLIIGPDHRILLPTSAIVGAMFLIACDAAARIATGANELPVGVITALVGTPVFMYLLRRRKTTYSL
ncbi:MAG TPA: iron chelate uptake ABC transporter family permease subunit [Candidatus Nanoarchaeia archaeon]|nr:iron chelate uptake ABC transporter family permease subunit [Candidatus Nanoarchaeia archaeon]